MSEEYQDPITIITGSRTMYTYDVQQGPYGTGIRTFKGLAREVYLRCIDPFKSGKTPVLVFEERGEAEGLTSDQKDLLEEIVAKHGQVVDLVSSAKALN